MFYCKQLVADVILYGHFDRWTGSVLATFSFTQSLLIGRWLLTRYHSGLIVLLVGKYLQFEIHPPRHITLLDTPISSASGSLPSLGRCWGIARERTSGFPVDVWQIEARVPETAEQPASSNSIQHGSPATRTSLLIHRRARRLAESRVRGRDRAKASSHWLL